MNNHFESFVMQLQQIAQFSKWKRIRAGIGKLGVFSILHRAT